MDFNIAETGFCLCWIAGWLDILMVIALCALLMAGYPVAFSLAGVALVFATLGPHIWRFRRQLPPALPATDIRVDHEYDAHCGAHVHPHGGDPRKIKDRGRTA